MSVPSADVQATFAATLVDEWVRLGVAHAVVCPGSRSTPLALALAARDDLTVHVRLDERGACFFGIGLALASGRSTVLCTTSGTAAVELHPGVVEASHARVPLVVCTADRPPRLHHVGAPQTIEQAGLYGSAARWAFDPGPIREADRAWWRSLAARALREAEEGEGPVQLNLAFEEPLYGTPGPLPEPGALPARPARRLAGADAPEIAAWSGRGLIVAGGGAPEPALVLGLADHLGWPVLADPRSGARVEHPSVVAAADAILRDPSLSAALEPETVVLLGQPWASRVVDEFVASSARRGARVVAAGALVADPARVVIERHPSASGFARAALGLPPPARDAGWLARWMRSEAAAQRAIDEALAGDPLTTDGRASEPSVARHLFGSLDASVALFVSSSMPVRDLEWFARPRTGAPLVLANRGANGIDGVTSSALGVAAASAGPVVALLGDLAFLHDVSALATLRGEGRGSCTLVVLDNSGGGIFNFLPQADALEAERFERLFGTPAEPDVARVAAGFSLPVAEARTLRELDEGLDALLGQPGIGVLRVAVPGREDNRRLHERIHRAVADAVGAAVRTEP